MPWQRRMTFMAAIKSVDMAHERIDVATLGGPPISIPAEHRITMQLALSGELLEGSFDLLSLGRAASVMPVVTIDWQSPWHEILLLRSAMQKERSENAELRRKLQQATCEHDFETKIMEDENSAGEMVGYAVKTCKICGKVEFE